MNPKKVAVAKRAIETCMSYNMSDEDIISVLRDGGFIFRMGDGLLYSDVCDMIDQSGLLKKEFLGIE